MTAAEIGALVAAYFIGAIPTSYLVARWARGIDLRTVGSRNLGATNLYRTLGWKYAVPVGLFDAAKGAAPVLVIAPRVSGSLDFALLCGVVAIAGHVWSVFVRFRGGKGVATAAGVMLALFPKALIVAVVVWLAVVRLSGYVSLGSILAAAAFPFAAWVLAPDRRQLVPLAGIVAVAIIWFHRANVKRLVAGTENRFGRRAGPAAGPSA
jgi:glycerol-3-phosphate acyltransferase PlsY